MEDYLPISCLRPDSNFKFFVIGVIIAAERPKATPSKYATTAATKRYVFSFTICDEHGESINVSCWGTVDYVMPLSDLCFIGARVKISNPRVTVTEEKNLGYLPEVTSAYQLHLDAQNSSCLTTCDLSHDCSIADALEFAFHTPPPQKYSSKKVRIRDLMLDPGYCEGDFVNLVAVVLEVGPILDFKIKDRKVCRQEVKFVDQSDKEFYVNLVLWDSVSQVFTLEWKAGATVVQLTNVKLQVDKNTNRRFLCTTSRSILTIDPNTDEGHQLANYAMELDLRTLLILFQQERLPEQFFRNKAIKQANVAALGNFISRISPGGREQAVLHNVMIMTFNLERGISAKCGLCGRRSGYIDMDSPLTPMCFNETCRNKEPQHQLYFDFSICIGDATGAMKRLRITGDFAVKILGQPEMLLSMSADERAELVNRFWFEYFEIGILIEHRHNGTKELNVIHLEPITFLMP
ncbi:meiosis-specific with OB domain-containing protein-like isoform X1 [Daphnia carinata]|uniref:meiosis-specific with OB domain-containing protein-like isoform X1 n=1 Tax=Daphnia carinata TaxID=120202 RepID=UPI00257E3DB5|nr:meiosis-specific with OB domain-containing protein-like isoform X1 [Daphnia carinata]